VNANVGSILENAKKIAPKSYSSHVLTPFFFPLSAYAKRGKFIDYQETTPPSLRQQRRGLGG
jgi:hypothetical protein